MRLRFAIGAALACIPALLSVSALRAEPRTDVYIEHKLSSNGPGENRNPLLVNAWGISEAPAGPFWISDNETGKSSILDGNGQAQPLVVTIAPPRNGMPPSAPTGNVFNGTTNFQIQPGQPAIFIFATEDGTISGWNPSVDATHTVLAVDNSASGAVYKGLATNGTNLYATNFFAGTVDIFDANFAPVIIPGAFQDSMIPAGFAPFNIANISGKLWVTYAMQDADKEDDVAGPGNGFIDVFDYSGNLLQRFAHHGVLNSPWGLALAPSGFGAFSGDLLVGNFGDGRINAFDPTTGASLGGLLEPSGRPLTIDGLWGLIFGNGGAGTETNVLYFTAGPNDEQDGLFGKIRAQHP